MSKLFGNLMRLCFTKLSLSCCDFFMNSMNPFDVFFLFLSTCGSARLSHLFGISNNNKNNNRTSHAYKCFVFAILNIQFGASK
ncbi:uncharacterized protein DS421_18g611690 [Arachis hypogaea]|nr:uncharacterized protein DS421_18g611690 [Arachis hypogaea]